MAVRVHELAREFGVESKIVLSTLKDMGEYVKSASSTVEAPVVRRLTEEHGDALRAQQRELVSRVRALILAGRKDGTIPPGPPAASLAAATLAAIEAAVITVSGPSGVDVDIAQRIATGLVAAPP